MSDKANWAETVFLFGKNYLKENRGVDASSAVISDLKDVAVYVGDRTHGPMHTFIQAVWQPSIKQWIKPACELHITNTETTQRQSLINENDVITEEAKVQVTYLGATASSKSLEVRMDLTKLEALQFAKALIAAAENIERSEKRSTAE